MSDNIKVVVKVRPLISRENNETFSHRWDVDDNTLVLSESSGRKSRYTFDKVYNENTKTQDVYNDVAKPIVEALTTGINGTIVAYGQTSSGKTYTMMGTNESPGIIKLAVLHLFDIIKATEDRDFLIRVSYLEIYNEEINDLLNIEKNIKIKILDKPRGGVQIQVKEEVTRSPEEIFNIMEKGEANRHIGGTNMNEKSSRSHTIFQITIESTVHATKSGEMGSVNVSQLNLVDLAGSERPDAAGSTRFIEGTYINRSLSTLTLVIKQLSEGNNHVNYRDSKLTRLLQHSLGGNAKTSIICAVTPAAHEETVSTLQFALRAKDIKNKPIVNEVVTQQAQDTKIHLLTKQIAQLQAVLEGKRNVEEDNEKLQMKLKTIQSQILSGSVHKKPTEVVRDRRKTWCAPRGAGHDAGLAEVAAPKFSTPALKYNPELVGPPAASSAQTGRGRAGRLHTVPEEAAAATTPPKVTLDISGEIINIDSDDEDGAPQRETSCSPYHNCYDKRGTPPCVLRDMMKKAEQEKNEIMELTMREKIYPPAVNELLPKLEENTRVIKQLQDRLNSTETSMKILEQEKIELLPKLEEKTRIIQQMQDQLNSTENSMKNLQQEKEKLTSRCEELQSLITDTEVSYETLKNKSKCREEELLSLLEKQNVLHKPSIDKNIGMEKDISSFMNLSKDFSLVCSDNENSIVGSSDDIQSQIIDKNTLIEQLKTDLQVYKKQVISLESTVERYKNDMETVSAMKTKNSSLVSDMETLQSTVKSLKDSLDIANADIDSYKAVIKDLNLKVSERNGGITQEIVENIISNEKKISANNENIHNAIETLQNAVHKSTHDTDNVNYNKCINEKDTLISEKEKEIINLNDLINKHSQEIHRITTEKDNFIMRIDQLNSELSDFALSAEEDKNIIHELTAKLDELSTHKTDLEKRTELNLRSLKQNMIDVILNLNGAVNISIEGVEEDAQTFESLNSVLTSLKKASDFAQQDVRTELSSLRDRHKIDTDTLQTEITKIQQSHDEAISTNNDLKLLNTQLNQQIHAVSLELIDIKESNVLLKQEITDVIDKYQCEIKQLTLTKEEIDSLYENAKMKNSEYQKEIDEIRQSLVKSREENRTLELELANMNENFQVRVNSLLETIKDNEGIHNNLKEHNSELCQELDEIRHKIKSISEEKEAVLVKMNQLKDNLFEARNELQLNNDALKEYASSSDTVDINNSQHNMLSTVDMTRNVMDLFSAWKIEKESLSQLLVEKDTEINDLKQREITLLAKGGELMEELKLATTCIVSKDESLKNIYRIVTDLTSYCQISENNIIEQPNEDYFHIIYRDLEEISLHVKSRLDLTTRDEEITERVIQLNKDNENLRNVIIKLEQKQQNYDAVIGSIYNENSTLTNNLSECEDLLHKWTQRSPNHKKSEKSLESLNKMINEDNNLNATSSSQAKGPKSLNSLCCDIIRDVLIKDVDTSSNASPKEFEAQCTNDAVNNTQINALQIEIHNLKTTIDFLRNANKHLIEEKEDVRKEIQLLMEPTIELNKKIASHRTNLSTLTATTYAENKMLKTKVKVLQYHHNRLHNVCQNYMPSIRNDLTELKNVLSKDSDLLNNSIKRYSLPNVLDATSTSFISLKNDVTIDCDALMLDNNFTLHTSDDNTLIEQGDTFVNSTQVCIDTDATCNDAAFSHHIQSDFDVLVNDNQKMAESLHSLQEENLKLKQLFEKHSMTGYSTSTSEFYYDGSSCKNCSENSQLHDKLADALARLAQVQEELRQSEEKYKSLELDIPSAENLIKKVNRLEKELTSRLSEYDHLNNILCKKSTECKDLQAENDNLSTQIMESITEIDDLSKKVEDLKEINKCLENRCIEMEMNKETDALTRQYQNSMSEKELSTNLDSSSRCKKICSLQNELLASKEDSKKITEDFATMKNHLDRSDFSLQNMDNTMAESNIFLFTNKFDSENTENVCMSDVIEEVDPFVDEKRECLAYFSETTDTQKENLDRNIKVIDLMKMLHHKLTVNYGNEVENLNNKLHQFEQSKREIEAQVAVLRSEHAAVARELELRQAGFEASSKNLTIVRSNIDDFKLNVIRNVNGENYTKLVRSFTDNVLHLLDKELSLTTVEAFEALTDQISTKHQSDLTNVMEKYTGMKNHLEGINLELTSVKENLRAMETQLSKREEEYALLKTQKDRVHEISQAVTLDIVKRELELSEIFKKAYQSLIENHIISEGDIDLSLPTTKTLNVIFEKVLQQNTKLVKAIQAKDVQEKEVNTLLIEFKSVKAELQQKNVELSDLKVEVIKTTEKQVSSQNDHQMLVQQLEQEVATLKETLLTKDGVIKALEESQIKDAAQKELESIKILESDVEKLRAANEILVKEKQTFECELSKAALQIKQLKQEVEFKLIDVTKLTEEIRQNVTKINTITAESEDLMQKVNALRSENARVSANTENMKQDYEAKCQALAQLQANIKTHEKTAIIQTGIINRLQKQKDEDAAITKEKELQLQQLTVKNDELLKEMDDMKQKLSSATEELQNMKVFKDTLEIRVSELESQATKSRVSGEARGRLSQLGARRDLDHDSAVEAVFSSRDKPDDLFLDADDHSSRSSPARHSRRLESALGRSHKSDRDDEPSPRLSSECAARRRRRQSVQDLHRSALHASRESVAVTLVTDELAINSSGDSNSELSACRAELAELRARCRELDEECDACAEHLRDADDAVARLRREKAALENTVAELMNKLKNYPIDNGEEKRFVNAAVNTDQDWSNLHSVVVDRMSYDAAVERVAQLTRALEELRGRNREMKARLERAEDREQQLSASRAQLAALQQRYRELDEECETCARHLHERDERCRQLRAAKEAAEAKLREYAEGPALSSARKKRQSLHDANREPHAVLVDATTDTGDLPCPDRETVSDESSGASLQEMKQLNAKVQVLSREKEVLERRLRAAPPSYYVATGSAIVQNQQMTDIMKENQKLKNTNAKLIALCKKRGKIYENDQENIPDKA